jgi:predicted XRE-type DNA-binding protein
MAKNFRILQEQVRALPGAAEDLAERHAKSVTEMGLYQLRVEREFTQVQLAELLDMTQPGISRMENADDVRVSTLREYLAGMGANLVLQAVFADGATYPINLGAERQTQKSLQTTVGA